MRRHRKPLLWELGARDRLEGGREEGDIQGCPITGGRGQVGTHRREVMSEF